MLNFGDSKPGVGGPLLDPHLLLFNRTCENHLRTSPSFCMSCLSQAIFFYKLQWQIQGSPEVGAPTPKFVILQILAENEKIGSPGERGASMAPPRSANVQKSRDQWK